MKAKIITTIIIIVVAIVVLFSIIGGTANDLTDAADSITDANNCSEGTDTTGAELTYNISSGYCLNSSGGNQYVAGQYDLPLNGLFDASGVVLLILMAVLFMIILGIAFYGIKK